MLLLSVHTAAGLATTNAKRNPVLSQFIELSVTLKYREDVVDTGAKDSQFHDTIMLSRVIWTSPKNRRLYTRYGGGSAGERGLMPLVDS